jgi:hypothetical protein
VTGGSEGNAFLWVISSQTNPTAHVLEKKGVYNFQHNGVQSLQFRENYLIAGTVNGDIHCIKIWSPEQSKTTENSSKDSQPIDTLCLYKCNDVEAPLKIAFSMHNKYVFSITQKGILSTYSIQDYKIFESRNILKESSSSLVVNMAVCKNSQKIFICLRDKILVFEYQEDNDDEAESQLREKSSTLTPTSKTQQLKKKINFELHEPVNVLASDLANVEITHFIISEDENYMALAYIPKHKSENNINPNDSELKLYKISVKDLTFTSLHLDSSNKRPVGAIDFSEDCNYLLVLETSTANSSGNVNYSIINVNDGKVKQESSNQTIQPHFPNIHLPESPNFQKISKDFVGDNQVQSIIKFSQDILIVSDNQGIIRIFKLYQTSNDVDIIFVSCQHLNNISNCKRSPNNKLISSSLVDKCIFIWQLIEPIKEAQKKEMQIELN